MGILGITLELFAIMIVLMIISNKLSDIAEAIRKNK